MKKYIFGAAFSLVLLASPAFTQAAALTSSQINAIVSLLQSFGADQTTINNVQISLNGGTPTTGGGTQPWCHTFNTDLTVGNSGDDVLALHTALIREGLLANYYDDASTFEGANAFGESTAAAVVQFQAKYGIRQTGYVGPITRAKLNSLYGCGPNVPPPPPVQPAPTAIFTADEATNATVSVGDTVSYTWNSTNGTRWNASYIATGCTNAGSNVNGATWKPADGWERGTTGVQVTEAMRGCTLFISYNVYGAGGNARADVTVNVVPQTTQPSITVLSPNGGEAWVQGSSHTITWNSQNLGTSPIRIFLNSNSASTELFHSTTNDGHEDWTVPSDLTLANDYKILIKRADDLGLYDSSDAPFSIVAGTVGTTPLTLTSISPASGPVGTSIRLDGCGSDSSSGFTLVYTGPKSGTAAIPVETLGAASGCGYMTITVPSDFPAGAYTLSVKNNQTGAMSTNSMAFTVTAGTIMQIPQVVSFNVTPSAYNPHAYPNAYDVSYVLSNTSSASNVTVTVGCYQGVTTQTINDAGGLTPFTCGDIGAGGANGYFAYGSETRHLVFTNSSSQSISVGVTLSANGMNSVTRDISVSPTSSIVISRTPATSPTSPFKVGDYTVSSSVNSPSLFASNLTGTGYNQIGTNAPRTFTFSTFDLVSSGACNATTGICNMPGNWDASSFTCPAGVTGTQQMTEWYTVGNLTSNKLTWYFQCSVAAPSTTYTASADFSTTQGQKNWQYLSSSGAQMTFDATNNRWKGSETYLLLWGNGGHPGSNADAVRRWLASQAGNVRITGNVRDGDAGGGDGVNVSIRKSGVTLWQQTIANGNTTGFNYDLTASVYAGETIDFVINKIGNDQWDTTVFDPTIVWTATTVANTYSNPGLASALSAFDSAKGATNPVPQSADNFAYVWNRDLQIGSPYPDDIAALQQALAREGVYAGEITGGFYNQTYTAVKAFQEKYGINATGYVGPLTRAQLNTLFAR